MPVTQSPETILAASLAETALAESFHFEMDANVKVTISGIPLSIPVTFVGDFQEPARMRGTAAISVGFASLQTDIVTIGDTVYATDPETGEWEVNSDPDLLLFDPLDFVGAGGPKIGDFEGLELAGVEVLQGDQVYHLTGMVPAEAFGESEGEAQAHFWIGVQDMLFRQVRFEGELSLEGIEGALGGSVPAGVLSGAATITITITFSDYDEPVVIEAPEVSTGTRSGVPGVRVPDQGRDHIQRGQSHPPYNSVPATSGWHYSIRGVAPASWGVHDEVLPDEALVHNLEHGGVGVHYNCPGGCAELVKQLAAIVARHDKVIMAPYPGMDTRIALTAWNFLDGFNDFNEARITAFIDHHVSSPNAPEPFVP